MMKLYVLKPIRLKRAGRVFDVAPGAIVEISKPEKAKVLIDSGHVRAILPPDEVGDIQAVRIYSKILQDEIWVLTSPAGMSLCPADAVVYLPDEIQNLKGASHEDIQAIHRAKLELDGKLIAVNQKEHKAVV